MKLGDLFTTDPASAQIEAPGIETINKSVQIRKEGPNLWITDMKQSIYLDTNDSSWNVQLKEFLTGSAGPGRPSAQAIKMRSDYYTVAQVLLTMPEDQMIEHIERNIDDKDLDMALVELASVLKGKAEECNSGKNSESDMIAFLQRKMKACNGGAMMSYDEESSDDSDCSSDEEDEPKGFYTDNDKNRSLGRVGKPYY